MTFTGERVIPGEVDADLFNEHWARYLFAQQLAAGKRVLDVACGSGYGSALLAEVAQQVVGVDIASDAVCYAKERYARPDFVRADCIALPFAEEQFDLLVAFEIIEHLSDSQTFLEELRRVVKPQGRLLLSTPNKLYYTQDRGEVNPFHEREYSYAEFSELLAGSWPHYSIFLQDHIDGLLISGANGSVAKNISSHQSSESVASGRRQREAYYMIAICSQQPLPEVPPLLYLPPVANVLRERETHIRQLEQQLSEARGERDTALAQLRSIEEQLHERTTWARDLERQAQERTEWAQQMQQQFEERARWAAELHQTLQQKDAYILELQEDFEEKAAWAKNLQEDGDKARAALAKLQQDFDERTAWALRLDADVKERTAWAQRLDAELKQCAADLQMLYSSPWYRIGKKLRFSPVPASDQPNDAK